MKRAHDKNIKADWSLFIGFFFVLILTITSIGTMLNWVTTLGASKPVMILLGVTGTTIWICGLAFLYHAENSVFSKRK